MLISTNEDLRTALDGDEGLRINAVRRAQVPPSDGTHTLAPAVAATRRRYPHTDVLSVGALPPRDVMVDSSLDAVDGPGLVRWLATSRDLAEEKD